MQFLLLILPLKQDCFGNIWKWPHNTPNRIQKGPFFLKIGTFWPLITILENHVSLKKQNKTKTKQNKQTNKQKKNTFSLFLWSCRCTTLEFKGRESIQKMLVLHDLLWMKILIKYLSWYSPPSKKKRKKDKTWVLNGKTIPIGLKIWLNDSQEKPGQALLMLLDLFAAEINIIAIPTHFLIFSLWHRKLTSSKLHQLFCCYHSLLCISNENATLCILLCIFFTHVIHIIVIILDRVNFVSIKLSCSEIQISLPNFAFKIS